MANVEKFTKINLKGKDELFKSFYLT